MFKIPVQHEKHHVTKVSDETEQTQRSADSGCALNQFLHFQNLLRYLLEWKPDLLFVFTNTGQVYAYVCSGPDSDVLWQLAQTVTEPLSSSSPKTSLPSENEVENYFCL